MAGNERIRKYLDAGNVLGQVTRGRAEEIVRELVNAGDIQRGQAQECKPINQQNVQHPGVDRASATNHWLRMLSTKNPN